MKIDKNIQITYSTNTTHLSMSKNTRGMILEVLSNYFSQVGEITINCQSDLQKIVKTRPDLVFIGMKDLPLPHNDNDQYISTFLQENNIASIGSPKQARIVSGNKVLAKKTIRDAGLPTADFFIAQPKEYHCEAELPIMFPLFIKPPNRSRGAGIDSNSIVKDFVKFQAKIQYIYNKYQSNSLVEKYLDGREFSVAILEQPNNLDPLVMPIEIIALPNSNGDKILGSVEKSEDNETVIAVNDTSINSMLCEMATKIFYTMGAKDYGRIDFRMDSNGDLYFLEANLSPGLGRGYFARACKLNYLLDYDSIILKLVEQGLNKNLRHSFNSLNLSHEKQKSTELHGASSA